MTGLSDEQIIKGYLEGAPEAHREVDRWIKMVVHSRNWGLYNVREDIQQDIRRRLYENLLYEKFHGNSSLKTYVVQIAKYVCIEFLRQKIRHDAADVDSMELKDGAPSPEQSLARDEKIELATRAMADLPENCRELFGLIFNERLPYQTISERLGIAEGTVKSRAWRCRAMLVKSLKRKGVVMPLEAGREVPQKK